MIKRKENQDPLEEIKQVAIPFSSRTPELLARDFNKFLRKYPDYEFISVAPFFNIASDSCNQFYSCLCFFNIKGEEELIEEEDEDI